MKKYQSKAWVESIIDTAIGTAINFPLNILLLWVASSLNLTILQTSLMLSVIFIVMAIIRKTVVRCYFHTKHKKSCSSSHV